MQELFNSGIEKEKIEHEILKFFKEYDESKEPATLKLQKRIDQIKKNNLKM